MTTPIRHPPTGHRISSEPENCHKSREFFLFLSAWSLLLVLFLPYQEVIPIWGYAAESPFPMDTTR
jgi:hypothetical protein